MPGPLPSKIIGHEHLPQLNGAITKVNDAIDEAKLAIEAGVLDTHSLVKLQGMQERLLKIKRTYFPGH